jgi:oligopeptidase A
MFDRTNPLLDTVSLPRFAEISPSHIAPAIDFALAQYDDTVAKLIDDQPTSFETVWLPYERTDTALNTIWSAVSHLNGVADTPALRAAYVEGERRLVEHSVKVGQNRDLYDIFVKLSKSREFATLPDADRAAVEYAIREFTLAGVALEPKQREQFKAISVELCELSTQFGNAVLDATDAWSELVTDEIALTGVSDTDKAMFADAAKANGQDGWLVTLQQPSVNAILTFAENRDLRARVYRAFVTRASDEGPNAGQFDNTARITRILELRRQTASLLGFADPVEWSLTTKMAPNAGDVMKFLYDLADRAKPAATRDLAMLKTFAAGECGITDFEPWDTGFVANRLLQLRYAVNEQEVRRYFPVDRVISGWQTLMQRLFGITLVERNDMSLYHPAVRYFDVIGEDGASFAGLYVDLHARPGKRGGAWMDQARPRLADGNIKQVPVAYLVCNFAPGGDDTPSLLSHNDVTTLLHETGHCIHLLFTQVDRPSIAGTQGFEWDAIELPSQLMEDFAWDVEILTDMSGHFATGEPLPSDLFDRLVKARHFQAGMIMMRHFEFALFDLILHLGTRGSDPLVVLESVRNQVAVIRPPVWNRFPNSFSHIFAGGYASGYYSYLWAELLAADGFMAFAEAGTVDRATGDRFRQEVLARGATRPAADSFRAFRGRDADPEAMLIRHGLIDQPV